ncbi:MAG: sulfatase [Planctomycetota bacterium]|jgi:arylsulfatase A-like enzyme
MIAPLLLSLACAPQEPAAPPNFLVVLVDDLGYGDLGADLAGIGGRAEHRTPNISRLAAEGLVMTHGYSAAPNCAPSRACFQTGRTTPRHGVYTVGTSARGKAPTRELVPIENTTVLADEEVTLAEHLGAAGYSSAHVGKWHLGDDPRSQGYDFNVAGNKAGHPKSYFSPYRNPDLEDGPEGEYLTTRLTDESIALLDRMEPPFLLHLAYYTVHTPLQAPPERVEERRAAGVKGAKYAAMVEALDHEVGRLLEALERKGLADDTVVVLTSDNGGHMPVTNREILRGYKGTLDEGGVRVPWIVRWPGEVEPGVSDVPVHHVDLLPTFLAIAGAEPAADRELDGVDLSGLLRGGEAPAARLLHWHFPCYLQGRSDRFERFRTTPGGSLRSGRWKLIEYFHPGSAEAPRLELYDLGADPLEARDLAAEDPERAAALHKELRAWREAVGAPVPAEPEPSYAGADGGS